LWAETKSTILFVTHSIPEAIRVGNRILLLSAHPGQVKAELHSSSAPGLATRIEELLFDEKIAGGAHA
jgi:NitT/TauT family transport system ATP-binding protein